MQARVDYAYFDVDTDVWADEFVRTANDGWRRYPVVVVGDQIAMNPSLPQLQWLLEGQDVQPRSRSNESEREPNERDEHRST